MSAGKLYLCGTPIGNMEDVTIRLLKILRKVDMIACEDTRQTIKLLNRYKIKKRLLSYHRHSHPQKEAYILEQLLSGRDIALVSDAGMPVIADPGRELVEKAWEHGVKVEVVPGPSSLTAALALSGMAGDSFVFAGFLSRQAKARREELQRWSQEACPVIFYETPHRLLAALKDMEDILGSERLVTLARELTKRHEELRRGSIAELKSHFEQFPVCGEIVLLIAPASKNESETPLEQVYEETQALIRGGTQKKEAFKIKAQEYKIKKNVLYKYYVEKEQNH